MLDKQYPIIIDGGQSTVLDSMGCDLNHKLWSAHLIDTNPEALVEMHYQYAIAGAQIIATASYQASIPGLVKAGYTRKQASVLILKTVELASLGVEKALESGKITSRPLIGASIGPYGAYMADGSEYRGNYGVSIQELEAFHLERIKLLDDSDVDLLLFETFPCLDEARLLADLLKDTSKPAWVSFSCKDGGHINDGTSIEEVASLFQDHGSVFAIGVNCTAPQYIDELITRLKHSSDRRIVVYPNSGEVFNAELKTWSGISDLEVFVNKVDDWISLGADIIGGCCRIGPDHIKNISQRQATKA